MIKIDLITGFLGSGKTTFIRKYASDLIDQGQKVGILVNDYGAVNVDRMLLQDLLGDRCDIETIVGSNDHDSYQRRFRTKLISMRMFGYDRVLVEPSGIFDVEDFFDVLNEDPLDQWYEIGSIIGIADAGTDASESALHLSGAQLASSGCIILSHTGKLSDLQIEERKSRIRETVKRLRHESAAEPLMIAKTWDRISAEDFQMIQTSGYVRPDRLRSDRPGKSLFSTLNYMNLPIGTDEICAISRDILNDPACGNVFRIKGFSLDHQGRWTEINVTRNEISTASAADGQNILIVIGENLNRQAVDSHWQKTREETSND